MNKKKELTVGIIPKERIEKRIFWLRGEKVMLDSDLAELYEVETKALNQAVKRNMERFPKDFIFQLTQEETTVIFASRSQMVTLNKRDEKDMRSQIVTASKRNIRFAPYAFTELGVAMLSSVLKSERAVAVNIQIMRTFVQLRNMLVTHDALRKKIETMERKYDKQFKAVFDVLRQLLKEEVEPKRKIGFTERRK